MGAEIFSVKFLKVGGATVEYTFEGSSLPLVDALEEADIDADGYDVRVNNREPAENEVVMNGDTVLLVPKIAGG